MDQSCHQTARSHSSIALSHPITTNKTPTLAKMLFQMDQSSPTPLTVSVNGGELHSAETTLKTESEFLTERIAAVTDLQELPFSSETQNVEESQTQLNKANGMKSNAPSLSEATRSN